MEIIELGSIYLNGQVMKPGCLCSESANIAIGDTVAGKALRWARYKNLLVATHCACFNISWEELNRICLIFGAPIKIDGGTYLCRSLKLGATPQEANEWEDVLAKFGADAKVWDWKNKFWGQESSASLPIYRVLRGGPGPTHWWSCPAAAQEPNIGFRPVLEQMHGESAQPENLLGKSVVAYGPMGISVRGKLVACDSYDLIVESNYHLYEDCFWAARDGARIMVDRASVAWLKEDVE